MKKKAFLTTILTLIFSSTIFAHNLWLETNPAGSIGESQTVHVYYGEYSYNYFEEVSGHFQNVADFSLWLITPDNKKIELHPEAGEERYTAHFTPDKAGVYTILLSSTKAEVVDWREYDLGILKPNFYASASVTVGTDNSSGTDAAVLSEVNSLVIHDTGKQQAYAPNSSARVRILFNGEPVAEQELIIGISDQWSKTIYTDKNGVAEFTLPWKEQYVIEAIYTEEVPGSYNDKDYEAVRHTVTHTVKTK